MTKVAVAHFIVSWCNEGLEAIFNITEHRANKVKWEKEKMWATLQEVDHPPMRGIPLNMLILRAQANPQRHYEIYEFNSQISEKEIRDMFAESPQIIADAIRDIGHKIYSDRAESNKVKIV